MDIIEAYREIDEEKRLQSTLVRRVEYLTTIQILEQYCSDKANCIDVGCGVGIYSLYMDGLGVKTTALDLVSEHIFRATPHKCQNPHYTVGAKLKLWIISEFMSAKAH